MSKERRFQTVADREQTLFDPESPVLVSRWRLTEDVLSRRLLLQVRMVNLSGKTVRRVFLRVVCRDGGGSLIKELFLLPMAEVSAAPGCQFGDDKPVELTTAGTRELEVYAQRVVYQGGETWSEEPHANYIAYRAPVRLSKEDKDRELLVRRAQEAGVQSAFRFRSEKGLWICTCGLPNADRHLRCVRCGADRDWLARNMDPDAPDSARPARRETPLFQADPVPPAAPGRAPAAEEAILPGPMSPAAPIAVMPVPMTAAAPVIPAPPIPAAPVLAPSAPSGQQEEEVPPTPLEKEKSGRGGRVVLILAAILAFLALVGAGAYAYLRPYLRYRSALQAQMSGDYETARKLYEELGDYKDSAKRATDSLVGQAVAELDKGNYQTALDTLEPLEGYTEEKAKCYYSLAVLAHNDGELEKAWGYIEKLEATDPDYPQLPVLKRSCYYAEGVKLLQSAQSEDRIQARVEQRNQAMQYFTLAEDYEKSADWIQECKYLLAIDYRELADALGMGNDYLDKAMDYFAQQPDYKDSGDRLMECRMYYASYHLEFMGDRDPVAIGYLEELADAGYPGAQELYDRIMGVGFAFTVTETPDSPEDVQESQDLTKLYIVYEITARTTDGEPVPVLLHCRFPDGTPATAFLNGDGQASGQVPWGEVFPTECAQEGEILLELYDMGNSSEAVESFSFHYSPAPPAPTEGSPATGG